MSSRELALSAPIGANGLTLLPYLDGERTPNRPNATGVLHGVTSLTSRADLARAAVEALLCSLADAVDALGITARRVLLIGGAARNAAVQAARAGDPRHGRPGAGARRVRRPGRRPAGGLGVVRAAPSRPRGREPAAEVLRGEPTPQVRAQYGALRDATA